MGASGAGVQGGRLKPGSGGADGQAGQVLEVTSVMGWQGPRPVPRFRMSAGLRYWLSEGGLPTCTGLCPERRCVYGTKGPVSGVRSPPASSLLSETGPTIGRILPSPGRLERERQGSPACASSRGHGFAPFLSLGDVLNTSTRLSSLRPTDRHPSYRGLWLWFRAAGVQLRHRP